MNVHKFGDWGREDYSTHRQAYNAYLDRDTEAQYNDGFPYTKSHKKNKVRRELECERRYQARHKRDSYARTIRFGKMIWKITGDGDLTITYEEWQKRIVQAMAIGAGKSVPRRSKLIKIGKK